MSAMLRSGVWELVSMSESSVDLPCYLLKLESIHVGTRHDYSDLVSSNFMGMSPYMLQVCLVLRIAEMTAQRITASGEDE